MYQEVLDGTASFEVHFNAMFPSDVLSALPHFLNIGNDYVGLVVVEACVVPAVIGIMDGWFYWFSSVLCLLCLKPILDTSIF